MSAATSSCARAAYTIESMEAFYCRAGGVCDVNARRASATREQVFLRYAAGEARALCLWLTRHCQSAVDPTLEVWLKATAAPPPPGERELWQLQSGGFDAAHALLVLRDASKRWIAIQRQLELHASSDVGRALHANLRALLDAWCLKVSSAYLQLQNE